MKERLYRKECIITIVFIILLLMGGHFAEFFVLFPGLQKGTIAGFPTEYFVPLVMGWFGLMVICIIQALVCNRFDDELERYVEGIALEPAKSKDGTVTVKGEE